MVEDKVVSGSSGEAGEVVTTDYWPCGVPNSTTGAGAYVVATPLTADGRIDMLKLGGTAASPTLQKEAVRRRGNDRNLADP